MGNMVETGGAVAIALGLVRIIEALIGKLSPAKSSEPSGCAECRGTMAGLQSKINDLQIAIARIEEQIKALAK